jgi:hypothetical protein
MTDLNKAIIKDTTRDANNYHIVSLAVYPFFKGERVLLMEASSTSRKELSTWEKEMANKIWSTIPGVSYIDLQNGQIVITHHGVLDNKEIAEMATKIIEPYLQTNINIRKLEDIE